MFICLIVHLWHAGSVNIFKVKKLLSDDLNATRVSHLLAVKKGCYTSGFCWSNQRPISISSNTRTFIAY